jgi:hypothetical protein
MNIPDQIKIGGHIVNVEMVDVLDNDLVGEANNSRNVIRLVKHYPQSQIEVTFLHELLHMCFYHMGIGMGEDPHTERTVEGLAQVLYQVLVDNNMVK